MIAHLPQFLFEYSLQLFLSVLDTFGMLLLSVCSVPSAYAYTYGWLKLLRIKQCLWVIYKTLR